ncbi:MAG: ABC transporter ATP-binding protein/permease [Cellvibrionaceae bacterium]|nr:ABC transporter ATP-binding protein/permease [Cellvibrionaceae bacterium]
MLRFFEQFIQPFPAQEPTQPPTGILAFCRHYTRGAELHLVILACLTGLLAMLEVTLFDFLGQLVDWLSTKERATFLAEEGATLWWMSFIVLFALPVTVLFHSLFIHQVLLGNYPMAIRWNMHRYLLGQSYAFYQNEFAGRVATKVLQTALAVRESVMKVLDVLLFVGVYFLGMLVLVAAADYRLMAPLLFWLLGYGVALYYFIPRLRAISSKQADARAMMTGRIVDSYTNIGTVKLFSHTQRESSYAKESMFAFLKTVYPQMRLVTGLQVSVWLLNSLLIFSIGALSIYLWLQGSISTGAIAIAIGLNLRLNGMSQWVMWEVSMLFENVGTVQDGMHTLAQPRAVQDGAQAQPLRVHSGQICFQRVGFHYGKSRGLFDDLSLTIAPSEKIGLIGRSGAGKSTLVNLLLRFHDVQQGAILIDGQNISQVQQKSLRAAIGVVTQDTSLLHRSVRDNILYGRPDATEAQMIEAAKQAHAHDFILGLSDPEGRTGYDAQVGERGVKLSGGQRQRIAIARVLLKDAPILVLDEATSALDSEIEAAIQENLYNLMQGKTVIAIAHRLSTIAAMDRLIVMDQGAVIEQGSHADLVAAKGVYAHLWTHQSGGFLAEV